MAKLQSDIPAIQVALIGAETLLGREIKDVLEKSTRKVVITSFSSTGEGNFGEQEGEAVFLEPLTAETAAKQQAILLAGTAEGALKVYSLLKGAKSDVLLIDCTGHLEDQPEAELIAPYLLPLDDEPLRPGSWLRSVAHPAASALALVLIRLGHLAGAHQIVAHIFEPASERGKKGVSELHQQTTNLLSFKPLNKDVYDAQVSFNLLPRYGEEAPETLAVLEQRIERHVASLLNKRVAPTEIPMPSLRLVQAPVFHGYSISLWIEFDSNVAADEISGAIASAQIEVRGENDETPNSVAVAGQSGLIAGDIRVDRNSARAAWLWVVFDNLRLTADAVAEVIARIKAVPK